MGVSCVLPIPLFEGCNAQQTMEKIKTKLDDLGYTNMGKFSAEYRSYNIQPAGATFQMFCSTSFPLSVVWMSDKQSSIVSDRRILKVVQKMSTTINKKPSVEIKGAYYCMKKEIQINVGLVMVQSSTKGVVLEIEYKPCCIAAACSPLLSEIGLSILDAPQSFNSRFEELLLRPDQRFTLADVASQYVLVCEEMRLQQQPRLVDHQPSVSTPGNPGGQTPIPGVRPAVA